MKPTQHSWPPFAEFSIGDCGGFMEHLVGVGFFESVDVVGLVYDDEPWWWIDQ